MPTRPSTATRNRILAHTAKPASILGVVKYESACEATTTPIRNRAMACVVDTIERERERERERETVLERLVKYLCCLTHYVEDVE